MVQISVTANTPLPMLFKANKPISWVLPLICMALGPTANYAMWIRRYMVDELNRDYIKLARAKGMPSSKIMTRHVRHVPDGLVLHGALHPQSDRHHP